MGAGDGKVHARENAEAKALCGARPDNGKWTRKQREVTCLLCLDETIRRTAKLVHYGQPREFTAMRKRRDEGLAVGRDHVPNVLEDEIERMGAAVVEALTLLRSLD